MIETNFEDLLKTVEDVLGVDVQYIFGDARNYPGQKEIETVLYGLILAYLISFSGIEEHAQKHRELFDHSIAELSHYVSELRSGSGKTDITNKTQKYFKSQTEKKRNIPHEITAQCREYAEKNGETALCALGIPEVRAKKLSPLITKHIEKLLLKNSDIERGL